MSEKITESMQNAIRINRENPTQVPPDHSLVTSHELTRSMGLGREAKKVAEDFYYNRAKYKKAFTFLIKAAVMTYGISEEFAATHMTVVIVLSNGRAQSLAGYIPTEIVKTMLALKEDLSAKHKAGK